MHTAAEGSFDAARGVAAGVRQAELPNYVAGIVAGPSFEARGRGAGRYREMRPAGGQSANALNREQSLARGSGKRRGGRG